MRKFKVVTTSYIEVAEDVDLDKVQESFNEKAKFNIDCLQELEFEERPYDYFTTFEVVEVTEDI